MIMTSQLCVLLVFSCRFKDNFDYVEVKSAH